MRKLLLLILLIPFSVNAYETNARSAILMDMDSHKIIYGKDIYRVQSVASISKIMTAIVAIENSDINKKIIVGDEVLNAHGSGVYIKPGEKMKIKDLIYGLMLRSGNDAALAIAVSVSGDVSKFVDKMNEKAKQIGMKKTVFNNPSGLDDDNKGNYSNAYDMAILMSYAMENSDFKKITSTKVYNLKTNKNSYSWRNKNKLLFTYKYINGGKTGFTKIAKRTLISTATKDGLNLAVVTLNDGSDWADHKNLYDEAFKQYNSYTLLSKGSISIIGENYYKNKDLYIKKDIKYPFTINETKSVMIKFELDKKRNYKNNSKVGTAKLYVGDKNVYNEDIYVRNKNDK